MPLAHARAGSAARSSARPVRDRPCAAALRRPGGHARSRSRRAVDRGGVRHRPGRAPHSLRDHRPRRAAPSTRRCVRCWTCWRSRRRVAPPPPSTVCCSSRWWRVASASTTTTLQQVHELDAGRRHPLGPRCGACRGPRSTATPAAHVLPTASIACSSAMRCPPASASRSTTSCPAAMPKDRRPWRSARSGAVSRRCRPCAASSRSPRRPSNGPSRCGRAIDTFMDARHDELDDLSELNAAIAQLTQAMQ